ncbi:MAG: hypothetical protein GXZ08_02285 [Tissierellia bacterium]|nr:hypothetical protein [Tissierellia bacterium]
MYSKFEKEIINMQDSYTLMYGFISETIINELGEIGDLIVREGTRRYGRDRGIKRREEHIKNNINVNMLSLFSISSDLPSDPRFKRNLSKLTEEERNSHTLVCPMADIWSKYGMKKIGRIYCEEFHKASYEEYGFGYTQVNLSKTLTQDGDNYCDFHVVLRKSNVPPELRDVCFHEVECNDNEDIKENDSIYAKEGFSSLCIRVYYYILEVLQEYSPELAEKIILKSLELWAENSYNRLKESSFVRGENLDYEFVNNNFPLKIDINTEPLWEKYNKYNCKLLFQKGFYNNFLPKFKNE